MNQTITLMSANNNAAWNGVSWSTIGVDMNGNADALAVYDNRLYLVGSFTNADGVSVSNIASYSATTGIQNVFASDNQISTFPNPSNEKGIDENYVTNFIVVH